MLNLRNETSSLEDMVELLTTRAETKYANWLKDIARRGTLRPFRQPGSQLSIEIPYCIRPLRSTLNSSVLGVSNEGHARHQVAYLAYRVAQPAYVSHLVERLKAKYGSDFNDINEYLPGTFIFEFRDAAAQKDPNPDRRALNDYDVIIEIPSYGEQGGPQLIGKKGRWPGGVLLIDDDETFEAYSSFTTASIPEQFPTGMEGFQKHVEKEFAALFAEKTTAPGRSSRSTGRKTKANAGVPATSSTSAGPSRRTSTGTKRKRK